MDNLNVVDGINNAGSWLVRNQAQLLGYVVNIVAAIVIVIVGMMAARFIAKTVNKLLIARHIDPTVADFLSGLVRYGIIAFTLIAALGRVGVQTASVIAALAAAGFAFALALQGSLSNLAAGVLLVTFRPFRAGEFVDLGGVSGTVLQVQIFSTTLRSADGKIVVVPNGKIIGGNIINYSREPERRNEFIIGVAYDADLDRVFKVLRKVVDAEPRVVQERGVQIGVNELAGSSVNVVVRCWSKVDDLQSVYWDLMKNFKIALDANKIGIPYPQMDVHFHQSKSAEATEKTVQPE
ncbi:small-conductance mechanosensitive channel MscS [Erwinia pyrifoliae]|uniref:small-conductance mechanosensitive channel MscS n=1 Tax=Erwinia pyrifoliae TaxID=79967 RepID=UPI00019614B7|nr:small-conductance mechanosensitive channel MscS [Erwinia pyrifoliae]AUX71640.1 mechanosensitive ion channel protein MscS [Erwinia pyrifoliae]MCA8878135.1 small-conductance mechanosensitive channel MscS [Erwinia pyrifoliae]CAX56743.1 Small-conductance mechanosensitive channel [Erwinia pyrifoliae Ep1/96]CAY75583.1 yggB [Erwinia pyrifoliae DSM 12163]